MGRHKKPAELKRNRVVYYLTAREEAVMDRCLRVIRGEERVEPPATPPPQQRVPSYTPPPNPANRIIRPSV